MPTNNDAASEKNNSPTGEKEHVTDAEQAGDALGRRSFLKTTATAVAAGSLLGAGATAASAAEYDTITVPAGSTHNISLGSGDTLENTLIDVTASGASVSIRASGDGWAIRNVGVKGQIDVERPRKIFVPSVSADGKAVVENFYLGDGADPSSPSRIGGVWVNANTPHEGELVFRRTHIAGWADNGLYGSGPGAQEGPNAGPVKIEQSFAHNNDISGFRIGTNGSYVKDSTILVDGSVAPTPNGKNARGIYMKEGATMPVENCDISMTGPNASHAIIAADGAEAHVRNCRIDGPLSGNIAEQTNVSGNPSTEPPSGVPMTAEEAASGTSSAGGSSGSGGSGSGDSSGGDSGDSGTGDATFPSTLTVETNEGGPLVEYEFTVDGSAETAGATEANDTVTDNGDGTTTVTGATGNGYTDDFGFEGSLVDWSANVSADKYALVVNGSEVDPDAVTGSRSDGSGGSEPERTLTVSTTEGGPLVEYEFTVDGSAETAEATEVNDDVTDNGDGTTTVTGATGNGYTDSYTITGEFSDWSANVSADRYTVTIDGEEIDVSASDPSETERTLTVQSSEDSAFLQYELTVDGAISRGDRAEDPDTITDNGDGTTTVTGVTGNGYADSYTVRGSVENWNANENSDAYTLLVDGSEVTPASL